MKEAYEYLLWFWLNADFGPASTETRLEMEERYKFQTGNLVPHGYRWKDD